MRHLADVASLRGDPAAQRQHLVDGLSTLFDTSLGWFYVFDGCRPGGKMRPVHAVIAGEHQPVWAKYCEDFAQHVGPANDFYANAIVHSNAVEQQWSRSQLMSTPAECRRFALSLQLSQELRIGGDAVNVWRCKEGVGRVAGFSLFRSQDDPVMTARDRALQRLALTETRRLAERGLLMLGDPTPAELPPRLRQTLDGLLEGLTIRQIAARMQISQWTVREHVQRLYVKFGVNSREELMAAYVVRDGQHNAELNM